MDAITRATRRLATHPDDVACARSLVGLIRERPHIDASLFAPRGLFAALATPDIDAQPLVRAAVFCAATYGPMAAPLAMLRQRGPEATARRLLTEKGLQATRDPLLARALALGINVNFEIELLLTAARRILLLERSVIESPSQHLLGFAGLIARQCCNNEYVWLEDETETKALASLEERYRDEPARRPALLGALAMYRPVRRLCELGFDPDRDTALVAADLAAVLTREHQEFEEEAAIAATLLILGAPIRDATSAAVAAQYETDPYPRWLQVGEARDLNSMLGPYFTPREQSALCAAPRILIAGCGTGYQALEIARGFGPDASILAIDLSRRSLAYAQRSCRRLGVNTVAFAQGDILELGPDVGTFDVIFCDGVLHHMREPLRGWRTLVARLRAGGAMHVGLYSATARRDITRVRAILNAGSRPATDRRTILERRRELLIGNLQAPAEQRITVFDFFTYSAFRDLMFHVQEHTFSIPELRSAIDALDLEFRGFTGPKRLFDEFRTFVGHGRDMKNLKRWRQFEQVQPAAFAHMYNFWLYKPT